MDFLFLDLGILFLIALIGGLLATKIKQPNMIGYLIIGLILSPSISFTILGFHYSSIMQNSQIPTIFSQLGLVILLFFIGLNIAPQKFKKTTLVATVLGITDISVMFVLGFLIGLFFHWDIFDSLFLAFIISASSVIVTAKSVDDLRKLSAMEAEALLNMLIMEDIISIFMIVIFSGFLVTKTNLPQLLNIEYIGVGSFIAFIIVLTRVFMPSIKKRIFTKKNEELFVIFVLMVIFLISALLEIFNITPAIGAFFAGMLFSETDLSKEIESKLSGFKYAFAALFFVTYGISVNLFAFVKYAYLILISVLTIILGEVFIMSTVCYLVGFSGKGSLFIGSGLVPRNEDSLIFANIANSISEETNHSVLPYSNVLFSITGAIVIITTLITPFLLKMSTRFTRVLTNLIPEYLKFSASVISRTLRSIFFYRPIPITEKHYMPGIFLSAYSLFLLLDIFYKNYYLLIITLIILILSYIFLRNFISYKVSGIPYSFTGNKQSKKIIFHVNFTLFGIFLILFLMIIELYTFQILMPITFIAFFVILILEYYVFYKSYNFFKM
ncbi:MAG: cation:proton antiporter [Thermoplasmata archaeon]